MGGGASVFRRGGEKEANLSNRGEIANKDGLNPEETTHTSIERDLSEKEGSIQPSDPDDEALDDVALEAVEGVHDILCRLAQAHPTGTTNRWDLITQKLNRTMRRKRIPSQPLKDLTAEGLRIPKCWVAEREELAQRKLLSPAPNAGSDKGVLSDSVPEGKNATGMEAGAGESDTEMKSDIEGDVPDEYEGSEPFIYQALSKYEVFSLMRHIHDRIGPDVVGAGDTTDEIQRAKKSISKLYDPLPAETLRSMSQENRVNANLRQDSLVYGEIDMSDFLKVMVKLKRIHGHMMASGGSFWDLGAGAGKLVIAAAMMHNFESCFGVEILEDLRGASRPILDRWRKDEAPKFGTGKAAIRVDFIFADVMKQEGWIAEASLLFVHTNFSAATMRELRKKAGNMKVGTICLSVSLAAVDESKWGLLAVEPVQTSWGVARLFIHEKIAA